MGDQSGAAAAGAGLFGLFGVFFFLIWLLFVGVAVTNLVLIIMSVVEMTKIPDPVWQFAQRDRTAWLLITILVPFGGFVYWFGVRRKMQEADATCRAYWAQHYGWTATPPR